MNSPALKEWGAAVQALLDGRQTVLLRKGGIGEKRFEVSAPEFVFFPTVEHSHAQRVRPEFTDLLNRAAGDSTDTEVVQSDRVYHTGADPMERMAARAQFQGQIVKHLAFSLKLGSVAERPDQAGRT